MSNFLFRIASSIMKVGSAGFVLIIVFCVVGFLIGCLVEMPPKGWICIIGGVIAAVVATALENRQKKKREERPWDFD
nr:MAG TPA: hypothetical protein [Caudoviricetes sp.]